MNIYKKCTSKPSSFLDIDAALASGNPLRFRQNFVERRQKLIVVINDKTRDEKLLYDVNEKQQKYQHYHLEKLMNMNILQVKK